MTTLLLELPPMSIFEAQLWLGGDFVLAVERYCQRTEVPLQVALDYFSEVPPEVE